MSVRTNNVVILLVLIGTLLAASIGACTRFERLEVGAESTAKRTPVPAELYRFEYKQVHMGVQARLVLFARDSSTAERGARSAFDRIAELDAVMSDYRLDSELMHLVNRSGEGPVPVSGDLFHVLQVSHRLARESGGAFDITVGPMVDLWREARRSGRHPSDDALMEARSRSGYNHLELNPEDTTAVLRVDGMRLDLGGVAKGYAADEALRVLRDYGLSRAMIEFGGDLAAGDPPPGESAWYVTAALADRRISLANSAVSTSGDTQQFVEIDGVRYSHVVDPRTGLGLTDRIAVTVIAPTCILSDGLSTTLSILGPEDGRRLIETKYPKVDAIFRYVDD